MHRNVKTIQIVKLRMGWQPPETRKRARFERMIKTGFKDSRNKICKIKKARVAMLGLFVEVLPSRIWRPYGDSNPGYRRERAMS